MNPILQNVQVASFYSTWRDPNICHANLLHPGDQPECSHGNFMGLLPKLQFVGKPDMRPDSTIATILTEERETERPILKFPRLHLYKSCPAYLMT